MEINLIPSVHPIHRYRWPIALLVAVILFSFSFLAAWFYLIQGEDRLILEADLARLQQLRQAKESATEIDEGLSEDILIFTESVQRYEQERFTSWSVLLDQLLPLLPKNGSLTSFQADLVSQDFHIEAQFETIEEVAVFHQLLRNQEWVQSIQVGSIINDQQPATGNEQENSNKVSVQMSIAFHPNRLAVIEE